MRIGIVTLYGNNNFGNRLQNYAVQVFFENQGLSAETICHSCRPRHRQAIVAMIKKTIHFMLWPTSFERNRRKRFAIEERRKSYIKQFSDQYIKTQRTIDLSRIPKDLKNCCDYFVTGSDQVWHSWKNNRQELEYYFLMFAKPAQRLTIAPSFGFDAFPQEYLSTYKKGLEGFEYLSVREERGAELIKELTGQDATVLLDPTMLIDTSKWLKILRKPSQFTDDKYIFVYTLGGFKGEVRDKTCKLAEGLGLRVIDIMDIDSDYYIHTRPDEFLYWIHHARLVVTDSFHACVFSLLFKKPLACYKRTDHPGMGNRLDTLLNKFGITGRYFDELKEGFDAAGEARDRLFAADYSGVPAILQAERKKAEEFYQKCFHVA